MLRKCVVCGTSEFSPRSNNIPRLRSGHVILRAKSRRYSLLAIIYALVYLGIIVTNSFASEIESPATDLKSHELFFSILGPKDVLQITVANHPEFSGKVAVAADGTITLPLTGDNIKVDGLTKDEVNWEVTRVMNKYVKTPRVAVSVVDYNSKVYYVFGEVSRPGKFPMRDTVMTLRDALIESGFKQETSALGRVHVVTPDPENPVCNIIDAADIIYKGRLKDNVILKPGDVVYIPSTVLSRTSSVLSQILSPLQNSRSVTDNVESW